MVVKLAHSTQNNVPTYYALINMETFIKRWDYIDIQFNSSVSCLQQDKSDYTVMYLIHICWFINDYILIHYYLFYFFPTELSNNL